mgnify:CR=1 FL=1
MQHPEDVEAFVVEIGKTAELFAEKISEGRALLYFEALADLPLETVLAGLRAARRICTFFPKPVEIREAIEGSADDAAALAWALFDEATVDIGQYATAEFADGAIGRTLLRMFGGWPEAVDGARLSSGPEWIARRKEFMALYRIERARGGRSPVLSGLHESGNRARGFVAIAGEQRDGRALIGIRTPALPEGRDDERRSNLDTP